MVVVAAATTTTDEMTAATKAAVVATKVVVVVIKAVVVVETMVVVAMAVDTVMQRTIPLTQPTIGDSIIPHPLSLSRLLVSVSSQLAIFVNVTILLI